MATFSNVEYMSFVGTISTGCKGTSDIEFLRFLLLLTSKKARTKNNKARTLPPTTTPIIIPGFDLQKVIGIKYIYGGVTLLAVVPTISLDAEDEEGVIGGSASVVTCAVVTSAVVAVVAVKLMSLCLC